MGGFEALGRLGRVWKALEGQGGPELKLFRALSGPYQAGGPGGAERP